MTLPDAAPPTDGTAGPLLDVVDLRTDIRLKRSVVHALDGVSFTVARGETLGVVGESGCGKTMTALSLMRLLPVGGHVVGGAVALEGRDLLALREKEMRGVRGNDIGMIFQDPMTSLNPTMTVGDQIAESVRLHRGASRSEAKTRALDVLRQVGMPSPAQRARDYPHQLSGGMRQRAMIAIALACEPKLLIADEPTTALDVTIQKQILELIDDLRRDLGMAVILVTHDLGVIAGRADRVAVMYAGKIVETTDTRTLFARPRHPYTEALFEALPEKVTEPHVRLYSIPGLPPDLSAPPTGCRFAPRCRFAEDRCRDEEPPLDGESAAHRYACFFPVDGALRLGPGDVGSGDSSDPVIGVPLAEQEVLVPDTVAEAVAEAAADSAHAPSPSPQAAEVAEVARVVEAVDVTASGGAAGTGTPLVEIRGLVKDFPVTAGAVLRRKVGAVSAVAGVSLEVAAGETLGLVGESGCGKTTLGRLIVGLEEPTGGAILFRGRRLSDLRGRARRRFRRDIQLMFQDSYAAMDPRMRVGAILREPLAIQGVGSRPEQQRTVERLLDEVGLPRRAVERYPHEFSGGQRQRLGLARALALGPALIVADEPVSALDVSIQAQILNLMKELQHERRLTYLFISHDLAVVRYISNRIGVMYLGKLVEIGPSDSVYSDPVHPYTKGLLDAIPVADPTREHQKAADGVEGELPSALAPPSGCRFRSRCPFADDICADEEPPLRPFGPDGHLAACHFPLRTPLPVAEDVVVQTDGRSEEN